MDRFYVFFLRDVNLAMNKRGGAKGWDESADQTIQLNLALQFQINVILAGLRDFFNNFFPEHRPKRFIYIIVYSDFKKKYKGIFAS